MSAVPLDMHEVNRQMDRTKIRTFLGKNAAFFGPLMCNMNFIWDESVETAETDGVDLKWNPRFFMALTEKTRETVLRHELEHVARLHGLRLGTRDHETFNDACDHRINLDLESEGYSFEFLDDSCKDPRFGVMSEEEIYVILQAERIKNPKPKQPNQGKDIGQDLLPAKDIVKHQAISNVVRAIQQAKANGKAGDIPGNVELTVNDFLAPILDWRVLLHRWFVELSDMIYTWRRPNKRFQDIYMPSLMPDTERLGHLIYFMDISISVADADIKRFNSEVKYVKDRFNPERLTLVTFDTKIQNVIEITDNDPFDKIVVHGRGGTSLKHVRQYIIDHNPTAAIVFSDLECPRMNLLPKEIPVIWVVCGNPRARVKFGQMIHIPTEPQ